MTVINEDVLEKEKQLEVSVKKDPLDPQDLLHVKGIGKSTKEKLHAIHISTVVQLAELIPEKLTECKGFGIASAEKLISNARTYLAEKSQKILNEYLGPKYADTPRVLKKENGTEDARNLKVNVLPAEKDPQIPEFRFEKVEENEVEELQEKANIPPIKTVIEKLEEGIEEEIEEELPDDGNNFENEAEEVETDPEELEGIKKTHTNESFHFSEGTGIPTKDYLPHLSSFSSQDTKETKGNTIPFQEIEEIEDTESYQDSQGKTAIPLKPNRKDPSQLEGAELMDKRLLPGIMGEIEHELKSLNYTLLSNKSTLFQHYKNSLDFLGFKVVKINKLFSVLLVLPIKISFLRGTIVVSESKVDNLPSTPGFKASDLYRTFLNDTMVAKLYATEQKILNAMISQQELFQYCKKLLGETLTIKKSWYRKPLYFYHGEMQYKVYIDPIIISLKESGCSEKSLVFPYQRRSNIHFIDRSRLSPLIAFLEQKNMLMWGNRANKNDINLYSEATLKFYKECELSSIPFLSFGLVYLIIILSQL
jgi:hypothetical protein